MSGAVVGRGARHEFLQGVPRLAPSGKDIRDGFYGRRSQLSEFYIASRLSLNSLPLSFDKIFCCVQLPDKLGLCRRPGRQRNFMAVITAHPRAMHSNLATMETDFPLGPAPAVADAASATIMRLAGRVAAHPRKAFARWLRSRPSDRSARRSCPHLAKPSQGWARARAMKAW